jgi:oxaloacetate decarboxylase gamma subunit
MEINLVIEGVKFMFLGMGTVFAFLIIMIVVMNLMSYVIQRYFPEPQSNVEISKEVTPTENKKIIAAITAAIKYHTKG